MLAQKVEEISWCVHQCTVCHVVYCISDVHERHLRRSHESFYCPNGHSQYYPQKTDIEKWKEYAGSVEKQLNCCKSDKEELFDEITMLQDKKRELQKDNRYLKKMKTQYKNKLIQQE